MKYDFTMPLSHTCEYRSQVKKRNRNSRKVRKVMKRLWRKSFRGEGLKTSTYPRVRKMFRVERPWSCYSDETSLRQKSGHVGAGHARHWARTSLSRRFVQVGYLVDPNQDPAGQAGLVIPGDGIVRKDKEIKVSQMTRLVGNPKYRKRFVKICRGILQDLGLSLVGPLPMRALEIMWQYFGEEHFSAHGSACWCQLCRSIGPYRVSFLQAIGDSLYNFFVSWKYAANVVFSLIAPAPLKMAKFVTNQLWKWFKRLYN